MQSKMCENELFIYIYISWVLCYVTIDTMFKKSPHMIRLGIELECNFVLVRGKFTVVKDLMF